MTGTKINLSKEWIESYALRVGVDVAEVSKALADFQADVDSYTSMTEDNDMAIICNEEGFPRLDDYLPKKVVDTVTRVTDAERTEAKAQADEKARKERENKRAVHKALREKLGMPPI